MKTLDYVIEEKDNSGGVGANFINDWYAEKPVEPLYQGIKLGGIG